MAWFPVFLLCMMPAAAQKFAAFDTAAASSVYSSKAFAASSATQESSGSRCAMVSSGMKLMDGSWQVLVQRGARHFFCVCWGTVPLCMVATCCNLRRHHLPGEVVSWTGSFRSRRPLLGLNLHWSYAPAEVKVLTSADGGNYEEATGWRPISRSEPSFEETIMFPAPISAASVTLLMRGAKPWGYFGLAKASGLSGPYSFMLVSGAAATEEQCVVSSPDTAGALQLEGCLDGIVAGDGHDIFSFTEAGQLRSAAGACVTVSEGKLAMGQCDGSRGLWEVTSDGQVKQGNMCFAATGSSLAALDCDEAASVGGDKFFQVAVPAYDPSGAVAVRSMGALLRASAKRQRKLLASLQALLPKLATCKPSSLASMKGRVGFRSNPSLVASGKTSSSASSSVASKIAATFGVESAELAGLIAESAQSLQAVR